jgi:hypothetical protein
MDTSSSEAHSCTTDLSDEETPTTCQPDFIDFLSISVRITRELLMDPNHIRVVGDTIVNEAEKYLEMVKHHLVDNETVSEHTVSQLDFDPDISESILEGLPRMIKRWRVNYSLSGSKVTIRVCPWELNELVWVAFPAHIAFWFKSSRRPKFSLVDFYAKAYERWYCGYPIRRDGKRLAALRVVSPPRYLGPLGPKEDLTSIAIEIGHKHESYQMLKDEVHKKTFAPNTPFHYGIGIKVYSKSFQVFVATRDKTRGFGMAPLCCSTGFETSIIDTEIPTRSVIELPARDIYRDCPNLPALPAERLRIPLESIRLLFRGKL